ncbi:MAG: hypothetical protein RBR67_07510 [Desulfobacterium sp.]|jgi:hypothetical protein|nr:hypothetical protein [Desulfobacterium sp.]
MNPFKVLKLDRYASKREIIQAAAFALRDKKYSAREISQAQKMLLDPVSNSCQVFLHLIDLDETKNRLMEKTTQAWEGLASRETFVSDDPLTCLTIFESDHGN